ncbi:Phage P2 capsid scaffolding gpO-like protein [Azotobacter vinelandii CA]|uniref:Phage P2 capsid scaffolding gpO-like protein n=2 Tax=Azotobacter vinelandii TaxID=354 RepID=C1DS29_AZOVD|nr:GPO family capsid scaffolding protein [Azotobacter vinelandii]ACO79904.1 Phage P2 capsid scaffolding gpO-like protein [Azotobacter vinelandii DJ]AGK13800.1 Phage P2 capsid scaffolding gpO-like protein [Azotobacter vinelandii CA]AGK18429.1 Phage P2 capsid scaffolding gpO-like protein [Azotobacter vinelandii CA6]SFX44878.1 Phage capsid scaffolding protein (GPO) serine peptidase [Azotobacter vinelandii]GLK62286.1 phage capsid scaffolding protein [Azotobacter vinelandii]
MKKFRSKWFRVAVEGATTDGRNIERAWIEDMAATYDRAKYGARIWMEHYRSALPDSPFRAYGDVLAVKAEEVEIDGEKRLALFAQIEPTDDLVNLVNKLKQKIFTSIEVLEKFAGTGKAYLMGLAVTDSPASIGTEMLAFAQQHPDANPLKGRKQNADSLFSVATETLLEFEEIEDKPSVGAALFGRVQELLKGKQVRDDGEFAQIGKAVEALAEHFKEQAEIFADEQRNTAELTTTVQQLSADLAALKTTLGTTQDHRQQQRPTASGGNGRITTDC